MKAFLTAGTALLVLTAGTQSSALDLRTTFEHSSAFGQTAGETDYSLVQFSNSLVSELTQQLNSNWQLFTRLRLATETRDLIEPGRVDDDGVRSPLTQRIAIGNSTEVDLRELYVDGYVGEIFVRAGKQQVVWGQADGFRVLDAVNPMNLREFILEESEDRRIPTWMLNVELPVGELFSSQWTAQLLWIPDTSYDQLPSLQQRALFAASSPRFIPYPQTAQSVNFQAAHKPDNLFSDSDAGIRLNSFVQGWDVSVNYLYHYLDQVVPYQLTNSNSLTIVPAYERSHLLGTAFSSSFDGFSLRGEIALHSDRFYLTTNPGTDRGIFNTPTLDTVFGIDYNGISDTFISAQVFVSHMADYEPGITRDRNDVTFTLSAERQYLNQTLTVDAQWLYNANDRDSLFRTSVAYQWRSDIILEAGFDSFDGTETGLFGQFEQRDLFTLGISVGISH